MHLLLGIVMVTIFMVRCPQNFLYGKADYGPTFGGGHDIHICNYSNLNHGQYSKFGTYYYVLPGKGADFYLGGSHLQWLTSEIEVYQIN